MNLVKDLINRIETRALETKNPCKRYSTEERAEAVAEQYAMEFASYFTKPGIRVIPCRYLVVFCPNLDRWVIGFDFTQLLARNSSTGGYIGIAAQHGFYTF